MAYDQPLTGAALAAAVRRQTVLRARGLSSCEDLCLDVCLGPCQGNTAPPLPQRGAA